MLQFSSRKYVGPRDQAKIQEIINDFIELNTIKMKAFSFSRYLFVVLLASSMVACGGSDGGSSSEPVQPARPAKPVTLPLAEIRILVVGQSIASNCNEYSYGPITNVYQVSKSGAILPASDPFEWADCGKGTVWMPLGKMLLDAGIARKVVFMPIGVGGTKVEDWQSGGLAFNKLNQAIDLVKKQGIAFDLAFWYQGSANAGDSQAAYRSKLTGVLDYISNRMDIERWLIAVHSRCNGVYDRNVEAAQVDVGNMLSSRRFPGANNNALGDEYRTDRCHLNHAGQEIMAAAWVESIRSSFK